MGKSIPEIQEKVKTLFSGDLYLVLIILLVGLASFGIGRLSVEESRHESIRIEYPAHGKTVEQVASAARPVPSAESSEGKYVASKNGTKYHLPWCASAKRIKEENKIWFDSVEEAQKAGYAAAANCPGLE